MENKRDEIIAAVQSSYRRSECLPQGHGPAARKVAATPGRWNRRTWGIALAVVLAGRGRRPGTRFRSDARPRGLGGQPDTYSQVTWTRLNPTGSLPAARYGQAMAHDPTSGRLIMFGGYAGNDGGTGLNDTWAYDPTANTWTELNPSGTLPSARVACIDGLRPGHPQADHVRRARRHRHSPQRHLGLRSRRPTPGPSSAPRARCPPAERGHVDGLRSLQWPTDHVRRTIGDTDLLNDTWAYDPAANTWTELKPVGEPALGARPAGRWPTTRPSTG